jgi:hypothetical protein
MNLAVGSAAEDLQAYTSAGLVWEDEVLHCEAFEAAHPDVKITSVRDGRTRTGWTWTGVITVNGSERTISKSELGDLLYALEALVGPS